MAATAILNLLPVAIFDIQFISSTTLNFVPISHSAVEIRYLSKFKMAAVCHLGFSKILFLINGWPWDADLPSWYQIWCKNVDRRPSYGTKTKFKMAAAAILNLLPVAILTYSRLSTVNLNHHTKFRANMSIGG